MIQNKKVIIYKLLFSIIVSFMMYSYVNEIVYKILPIKEVEISIVEKDNSNIMIIENEETSKFYSLKEIFKKNKLKNADLKEKIEKNNKYIIYFSNPETKISFNLKEVPNNAIYFFNTGIKKVNVKISNKSRVLDMDIPKDGETYAYFPFQNSKLYFLYSIGIYFILTVIIYIVFNFLNFILKKLKIKRIKNFLLGYNPKKVFLLLYLFVSIVITISVLGEFLPKTYFDEKTKEVVWDQFWYWNMGWALKNLQFKYLVKGVSFRGYFAYVPMALAQSINDIFKIRFNKYWSFYILNNFFIILFVSYIIPEIYKNLTKKILKNYQIIVMFLLFSFFWRGVYYSVLSDMFGVIMFFWGILMYLKYKNGNRGVLAFLSGVLVTIASLIRTNYKFGVYIVAIIFILKYGFKILKIDKFCKLKKNFFVYFFLGVILIAFPQAVINFKQGHIGLFPYDKRGSYNRSRNFTLVEEHINDSLKLTLVYIYPYKYNPDNTALKLKNNFTKEDININQTFALFISNPLDTTILMTKKIFYFIDLKTPEMYPSAYKSRTETYIFSFFNYWIFLTGIYLLINKRNRREYFSKEELLLGSILTIVFTLPQLILAIEWRFFIIFYLIAYYIFSFKFTEVIFDKKFNKFKYFNFIILGEILFFVLSSFYFDSII
ncbi:hypothetical protein AB8B23_00320 [Leptotrichia sp. HSP-342]|uniref:Glycosyltransferase RgtA/B/C/D-like domain-containing protein n=1 Tax=Leptotrichia mesophila TaxID=3239303 RepID=A0AB39VA13_9FUSO